MDLELAKPKSSVIDLIPTFGGSGLLCRKEQLVGELAYDVGLRAVELFYLHGESWKQTLHISQSWCFKLGT